MNQKLIDRFQQRPRDFTWNELVRLLRGFGYRQAKPGRTGGSRRRFVLPPYPTIILHQPHPGNTLKMSQVDQVKDILEKEGLL